MNRSFHLCYHLLYRYTLSPVYLLSSFFLFRHCIVLVSISLVKQVESCMNVLNKYSNLVLQPERAPRLFIASSLYISHVFVLFTLLNSSSFVLNRQQTISLLYYLTYCPSFTIFLIIFNFSLLLFSSCSDTVSLRGSIKFHLIWTWWNCVRLSKELSLLYLVQILNWVWCCDPAALILRLMDFYFPLSHKWLSQLTVKLFSLNSRFTCCCCVLFWCLIAALLAGRCFISNTTKVVLNN